MRAQSDPTGTGGSRGHNTQTNTHTLRGQTTALLAHRPSRGDRNRPPLTAPAQLKTWKGSQAQGQLGPQRSLRPWRAASPTSHTHCPAASPGLSLNAAPSQVGLGWGGRGRSPRARAMLTGKEASDPGVRNWLGRSRCQVQKGEEGSRGRATGQGGQCCGPDSSHTAASQRHGEQHRQGRACSRRCPEAPPPGGQPCPAWQVPTPGLGPSAETGAGRPGGKRPCGPDTATRLSARRQQVAHDAPTRRARLQPTPPTRRGPKASGQPGSEGAPRQGPSVTPPSVPVWHPRASHTGADEVDRTRDRKSHFSGPPSPQCGADTVCGPHSRITVWQS
eukprot:XP_028343811.1 uncharacterized protein LOC114485968 [Physeter catodon]